jgi:hypothetical protein
MNCERLVTAYIVFGCNELSLGFPFFTLPVYKYFAKKSMNLEQIYANWLQVASPSHEYLL